MEQLLQDMLASKQLSATDKARVEGHFANGTAGEPEILEWLAQEYGLGFTMLEDEALDSQLLAEFPPRILQKYELLPLRRCDDGVELAVSRLFESEGIDSLKLMTGERFIPVLAPSVAVRKEIKKRLGVGADTLDSMGDEGVFQSKAMGVEGVNLSEGDEEASIIRFVNQILSDAIAQRTTDIHLEPFEDELRIRYRIDGVLQDVPAPTQLKKFQSAIISRIKILSNLDIAEKRVPQDGRLKVRLDGGEVDIRVSIIPMLHGEAVVLRLLRQDGHVMGLDELHMDDREIASFRRLLALPHGIVLVTGPTGSGKTTTLYAALQEINDSDRKIITIEDPIEYQIKGINQIQVAEKAGLTFARGLRSILRHDPDVVLIGEIRDAETAQIAVQAALTGHLVFSTLHTNDSPSAVTRLVDMGVEPYLVASSVEAVLAQRLVRVLCPGCKKADHSPAVEGLGEVFTHVGCDACRNTGFHGRRGVFELMGMDEAIQELILTSASSNQIRDAAKRNKWRSLYDDGLRVVRSGETSLDEVLRVTKDVNAESNW